MKLPSCIQDFKGQTNGTGNMIGGLGGTWDRIPSRVEKRGWEEPKTSSHLSCTTALQAGYFYLHFTDGNTENQRS